MYGFTCFDRRLQARLVDDFTEWDCFVLGLFCTVTHLERDALCQCYNDNDV